MARERIGIWSTQHSSRFPAKALETLSGNRTITRAEIDQYQFFAFDPGGAARTVTLPAEGDAQGALIFVSNETDSALEVLTIQNDGVNTIVTPAQNEAAILWCDGTNWYGLVGATA